VGGKAMRWAGAGVASTVRYAAANIVDRVISRV
jgi:hypothetical protein